MKQRSQPHPVTTKLVLLTALLLLFAFTPSEALAAQRYFAHEAVEDSHGVIAPWYKGLNGQLDYRARIAAETMKRYPWTVSPQTGFAAPDYVMNGHWSITADGTITSAEQLDWHNGDLGQRSAYSMFGWMNYYRYTGDPAAIAHVTLIADLLLQHCQTDDSHPWPRFLISVPTLGVPYGKCDCHGMIQLDIVAHVGLALVQAYQTIGETRWLDAAKHWGDLLANHCNRDPRFPPWNRYANPEDAPWSDMQTGGVGLILEFLDALMRLGYMGTDNAIIGARDAGRAYLRDVLLPRWTVSDTFSHHYWDGGAMTMQDEITTEVVARYLMDHPAAFPNWRSDVRNILTLFIHHGCTQNSASGGVFNGAWAYPESPRCCGRSLSYAPAQTSFPLAMYGVLADSEWARERARRSFILITYDAHDTGVVEDHIEGGQVVAGRWFKIVGPFVLKFTLDAVGWLPEVFGANRENHIVRSSAVVKHPIYTDGKITYSTYDAPKNTVDVLRLAFLPTRITADGKKLKERTSLDANGYQVKALANGDCIVTIRHDGAKNVTVEGDDPQECLAESAMQFSGKWTLPEPSSSGRESAPSGQSRLTSAATVHDATTLRVTSSAGAALTCTFNGNQVRLIGAVGNEGGQADIFVDGVRQLCGVDFWNPKELYQQTVWYQSGLSPGEHTLKVVATGKKNPRSNGAKITIESVQFSAATGDAGFGEGGGPTEAQRWIFGYPERTDYVDSQGHSWQPATEVVIRMDAPSPDAAKPIPDEARHGDTIIYNQPIRKAAIPSIPNAVDSWYQIPHRLAIAGTNDPVLYRYGMHGKDFTAYATVGPGTYHVRLKFMEHRREAPHRRAMDIFINGRQVVSSMDIAATAAGKPGPLRVPNRHVKMAGSYQAVDLVFDDIRPENGVIAVRFKGVNNAEAVVSAMEVGPGPGGQGNKPISAPTAKGASSTSPSPSAD
jgi:hypothetical protein